MAKKTVKTEKQEIKFVRLRNTFEDLVGFVEYKTDCIVIKYPLRIDVETIFEESRQILSLQEYLPQSVIDVKEVELSMEDVLFVTPVRDEFYEQFMQVSDFFYNNTSKLRTQTKTSEEVTQDIMDKTKKVVSILEAMANKKDKPIH